MKTPNATLRRTTIFLAVLLATSAAQADVITVSGTSVTLLSGANRSVSDSTVGGTVTGGTQIAPGALGRFDPTLGVLTNAVATSTINSGIGFIKGGGGGSANAYSTWALGGNSAGGTINAAVNNTYDFIWNPVTLTSTAANLNNFVGAGNIATNSFSSYLTVYKSGGTTSAYAHIGTTLTQKLDLIANESITYTYRTHSNASFGSGGDDNDLTIDFGLLANGTSDDESFSIFNLGGLGLTNFTLDFLGGDDFFDVTGGNVGVGLSGLYSAHFDGQSPVALTDYEGLYRLTFTDNVSGIGQYASNSIGTNYIDVRMLVSVVPAVVAVPEADTWAMLLAGLGLIGWRVRRRG